MAKLSLNKAAKHAGVAKSTILEALHNDDVSKKLSGEKNEKNHWEIDTAELDRVFPPTSSDQSPEPTADLPSTLQKTSSNNGLGVEVKMLREQIDNMKLERDREREMLTDQIEDLKTEAERRSKEHMQALAVLTDQRETKPEPQRKGLWARLTG